MSHPSRAGARPARRTTPLAYCMNVHPGQAWTDQARALRDEVPAIRARLPDPAAPFGAGLRLSAQAVRELTADPARLTAIRSDAEADGVAIFTANVFPYGSFHGGTVKTEVYAPDWRTPERLDYTCRTANLLAALLPEGVTGSLSTVPGSWKPWVPSPADRRAMAAGFGAAARHLADLEGRSGRRVVLAIEPEPGCFLETSKEVIRFWTEDLAREPGDDLRDRHLGLCFDCCHQACEFEDLAEAWDRLAAAGVPVAKVHLSAALRVERDRHDPEALVPFDEPVYLHQTHLRTPGGIVRHPDLAPGLDALRGHADWDEARVHFHVPLHWAGSDRLGTTRDALTPAFRDRLAAAPDTHLEIETYTFDVLPSELRDRPLAVSIADEFRWTLEWMG